MTISLNPRANQTHPDDAPQESVGAITSDSLAAESIKSGGGFSENDKAHISAVKGSNSTFNTTDTSGATALPGASSGAERERLEAKGLGSDEKGVTGVKYDNTDAQFSGHHSSEGYVGGATKTSSDHNTSTGGTHSGASGDSFADGGAGLTGNSSGSKDPNISSGSEVRDRDAPKGASDRDTSYSSGSRSASYGSAAGTAPNYAADIRSEGELKPKGANLTEGGIPKTKTFTGNVGGDKDPGRVAEQGFQKVSAENAASAGNPKYEGSGQQSSTGGAFDALSSESAPDTSVPDRN